jgi:hypothetical protein
VARETLLPWGRGSGTRAGQKGLLTMDLKEWAQQLRITAGYEDMGSEILQLLDDRARDDAAWEAVASALDANDVEYGQEDLVAPLVAVLERYGHVRKTFNDREEFDLAEAAYARDLGQVLMVGDKAGTFKWKVVGIMRKAGAVAEGAVKLGDDALLTMLGMLMP